MKIKKILAGGMAAVAAGATIAYGAFAQSTNLGNYVTVSGSALSSPWIVVGTPTTAANDGYAKDVVGAADIAAAVAGYATTTVAVGGESTISVANGADLSTSNTKLYYGDNANKATQTLTKAKLPTILASGVFTDDTGTTYNYDQYITVGAKAITFGNSGSDIEDPILYVDAGTSAATPLYNASVVFSKPLNVSDTDVQGNVIKLFGNEYTIGSGSTNTALILYGSSNAQTISEGASVTVNVGGTDHTISVIGVSSTTIGVVSVDGVSKEVHSGSSYTINGVSVYIDSVFYFTKESQVSQIKLSVGSSKITLTSGSAIETGDSGDTIEGTLVTITGDAGALSKIDVSVASADSDTDHVGEGAPFTDPLFGTFKIAFGGASPALSSTDRDHIVVSTSGDDVATVAFKDWRGYQKTIEFAKDSNEAAGTFTPWLMDSDDNAIHTVEGQDAYEKEYVIVKQGDFSHIFQINDIASVGTTNAKVVLKDVVSNELITVNLQTPGYTATAYIDGYAYYVNATANTVRLTWGTTAAANTLGNDTTVWPVYGLSQSEGLVIANKTIPLAVATNTNFILPTGVVTATFVNSSQITLADISAPTNTITLLTTGNNVLTIGRLTYNFTRASSTVTIDLNNAAVLGSPPFVVLAEEAGKNAVETDVNDGVFVTVESDGATTGKVSIASPTLTAGTKSSLIQLKSDTDKKQAIDRYGTLVQYDSADQNKVDIWYPDNQAIMGVAIGADPSFAAGGTGGTVASAVKITSPVAKLDTEVSTTGLSSDLILVGGPCANKLVAQLMNIPSTKPECYQQWTYTTGIIKEYTNAFGSGKKALVVAGTTADDTRSLAAKVMAGTLSYQA